MYNIVISFHHLTKWRRNVCFLRQPPEETTIALKGWSNRFSTTVLSHCLCQFTICIFFRELTKQGSSNMSGIMIFNNLAGKIDNFIIFKSHRLEIRVLILQCCFIYAKQSMSFVGLNMTSQHGIRMTRSDSYDCSSSIRQASSRLYKIFNLQGPT